MSELTQSRRFPDGQHPDADHLNAFVEHALPEHERLETLAHLSECANCREVVSLSLPPLEDAASVEPIAIAKPVTPSQSSGWSSGLFSGWRLGWIAAPALAALVILTIHLRNLPTGQQRAAVPGQMADSRLPAPPPVAAEPEAAKALHKPKAAPERHTPSAAKPMPAAVRSSGATPPIGGRDVAELKPLLPQIPKGRIAQPTAVPPKDSQVMGGPVLLRRGMPGTARSQSAGAPSLPRPGGAVTGFLRPPFRPAPVVPMPPAPVVAQSAPARPVPPAVLDQASISTSVSVSGAAPAADPVAMSVNSQSVQMDVVGRGVSEASAGLAPAMSAYPPGQAPLPSGLAVLSQAANLHQRLALDTRGQLFHSADDGQHWKAVSVPWRTRAITVTTVASVAETHSRARALTLAVPERYTPGASASAQPEDDLGSSSISGAVIDASGASIPGATVVATDGHTALVRTVQTDALGRYLVHELPPGVYHLEARAPGFLKQTQTAVLASSQKVVSNIVLPVGKSNQTVTVQASEEAQLNTFSRAMSAAGVKTKKSAAPPPVNKLPPIFFITTDTGDRWTSPDGRTWQPE